jgi:hypothetical protein
MCLLLVLLLPLAKPASGQTPPPAKPDPRIAFEESAVVATGLAPGEKVVWFAVEDRVDLADFSRTVVEHYDLGDAAADGSVRLALKSPPEKRSFWVAAGLKSGAFALATPEGFAPRRPGRPSRLGVGAGSAADEILDERLWIIGIVVRAGDGEGAGAWRFRVGDGRENDADGVPNGLAHLPLDSLHPLPGSPAPPAKVKGDDLWFIADPRRMEISVHKGGVAQ